MMRLVLLVSLTSVTDAMSLIGSKEIQTISQGGVVVLSDWLPPEMVQRMRRDAKGLFDDGYFVPDGLTNTALTKDQQGFNQRADRQTFRGGDGWNDAAAGDHGVRQEFADRMRILRKELAIGLGRPSLIPEDERKHEMTYNLYEPGAKLGRHLDEHHEETKGTKGWTMPTRRSVTWLVYLNDEWAENEGGTLHCYPRALPSKTPVGAHEGNLQVGWIDHVQPVFLDAWRASGQTALYRLNEKNLAREYISEMDFDVPRQPIAFDKFLVEIFQNRFEQISTARLDPRFVSGDGKQQASIAGSETSEQHTIDVVPAAGTLVVFDSVTLPHSVKEVTGKRRRIAATGWFHEDSQGLPV